MLKWGLFIMNYKRILLLMCAIGALTPQVALIADEQQLAVQNEVCVSQIELPAMMQPIIKDGRYYYDENDNHEQINLQKALIFLKKNMLDSMINKLFGTTCSAKNEERVSQVALLDPIQSIPVAESIELKITWIGHATFLIQVNGFNILTDPIFGAVKMGPRTICDRWIPVGIKFEDLPHIDAVVISHNHPDHLDNMTLKALAKKYQPKIFVPKGNRALVESMGCSNVSEGNWWDGFIINKNGRSLTVTCLPARHYSVRFSLVSYRKALWSSWMISANDKDVYFAGDTAYGKHFKQIGIKFPSIDIALMPIAPTNKGNENKHKDEHINAPEAVDAFIDLKAGVFIPMHYGTFFSKQYKLMYPLNRLHEYWQQNAAELADKKLLVARCGQGYII